MNLVQAQSNTLYKALNPKKTHGVKVETKTAPSRVSRLDSLRKAVSNGYDNVDAAEAATKKLTESIGHLVEEMPPGDLGAGATAPPPPMGGTPPMDAGVPPVGDESVSRARAWLEKSAQVVSERADQLENQEDKQAFQELSSLLKDSIPLPEATGQDVRRNLSLLKQRLVVTPQDSDSLKAIKNHLVTEINKTL